MKIRILRLINSVLLGLALLFLILVITPASIEARTCFCKHPTVDENLQQSAAVFVGTVISVQERKISIPLLDDKGNSIPLYEDWAKIFEFQVEQSWKGADTSTITITAPTGADCVFAHFNVGERHLVYAYTNAPINGFPGIGAGICNTRTKPIHEARAEILFLDILKKKLPEPEEDRVIKFARKHSSGWVRELALLRLRFPKTKWKNIKNGWEVLVESLNDPTWYIRRTAALALGHRYYDKNLRVVSELIRAMSDKRHEVRLAAFWSLGRLAPGNKKAAGALYKRLRIFKTSFPKLHILLQKDLRLMAEGLIWLPEPSDPRIRPLLVQLFKEYLAHPDPKMRLYGLMRLRELPPENRSAEWNVKRILKDPDPLVRKIADKTLDGIQYFMRLEEKKK